MSSSYSLFMMDDFPLVEVGESLVSVQQLALDLPGVTSPPTTKFTAQRRIDALNMDVFRVTHEHIAKKVGRVEKIDFTSFVAIEHFAAFYKRDTNLMILKVNKDDARRTMRDISRGKTEVAYQYSRVDLDKLRGSIPRLTGVYFTVDESTNISSGAYWGQRVDGDFRFDQALDEGAMTFIRFYYTYKDEPFHVGASVDYNVVIYDNHLDEHLELELVLDIKTKLLDTARIL